MPECPDIPEFYRRLRERGRSLPDLARLIGTSRSHLVRVIRRYPARGGRTRRKLAAWLTEPELAALGWDARGNIIAGEPPARCPDCAFTSLVLRGTNGGVKVPCGTGGAEVAA